MLALNKGKTINCYFCLFVCLVVLLLYSLVNNKSIQKGNYQMISKKKASHRSSTRQLYIKIEQITLFTNVKRRKVLIQSVQCILRFIENGLIAKFCKLEKLYKTMLLWHHNLYILNKRFKYSASQLILVQCCQYSNIQNCPLATLSESECTNQYEYFKIIRSTLYFFSHLRHVKRLICPLPCELKSSARLHVIPGYNHYCYLLGFFPPEIRKV